MDRYSEVEAKFDATDVDEGCLHAFVNRMRHQGGPDKSVLKIDSYKVVVGTDTYFVLNGEPLRLRRGDFPGGELTYKKRKSADSISNRVEINVRLSDRPQTEDDAVRLIEALGGKYDFTIEKTSRIWHLSGLHRGFPYKATLALYGVCPVTRLMRMPLAQTAHFLEIEIESESNVTENEGEEILDLWVSSLKNGLGLGWPMNKSLYEMYTTIKKEES